MPLRRSLAWPAALLLVGAMSGCFRESDENLQEGTDASPGQVVVEVELTDDTILMPEEISAGGVLFEVTNSGTVAHGFEIEGTDTRLESMAVDQMDTVETTLEPGEYTAFSPVDGDREAGLEVTFTVSETTGASGDAPLFDEAVEPGEVEASGGQEP